MSVVPTCTTGYPQPYYASTCKRGRKRNPVAELVTHGGGFGEAPEEHHVPKRKERGAKQEMQKANNHEGAALSTTTAHHLERT
eukprot:1158163-Pelagomonas_calceolata.AAC.1